MRVCAIDVGMEAGYGYLGGGRPASSGSHLCRRASLGESFAEFGRWLDFLWSADLPEVVAVASPFIDRTHDTPENLRVLLGFLAVLEMRAFNAKIRCVEVAENSARSSLLGEFLPSGSRAINEAVIQACRDRGWLCPDSHAAAGLCVAAYVRSLLDKDSAHLTTPLFSEENQPCKTSPAPNIGRKRERKPRSSSSGRTSRPRRSRKGSAAASPATP